MVAIINNNITSVFNNDNSLSFCCECNGLIISDDLRGDTICENCGLVESEKEIETKKLRRILFGKPQNANRDFTSFLFLHDISQATFRDNEELFISIFGEDKNNLLTFYTKDIKHIQVVNTLITECWIRGTIVE